MKKYIVKIIETREKEIEVSADNINDAFDVSIGHYNEGKIAFDEDSYTDTVFKASSEFSRKIIH